MRAKYPGRCNSCQTNWGPAQLHLIHRKGGYDLYCDECNRKRLAGTKPLPLPGWVETHDGRLIPLKDYIQEMRNLLKT